MGKQSNTKDHLPLYGPGPLYTAVVVGLTVVAFFCQNLPLCAAGKIAWLQVPFGMVGIALIALGIYMWIQAVIVAKVTDGIRENRLITTGIYAWVRNPIYSAFMILCTGIVLIMANVCFFFLPFVYWLFLTLLLKQTEEKWLSKLYGQEYTAYCKQINRCIPWFPTTR